MRHYSLITAILLCSVTESAYALDSGPAPEASAFGTGSVTAPRNDVPAVPSKYSAAIQNAGVGNNVDPNVISNILGQETGVFGYSATIRSPIADPGIGIAQFQQATANQYGVTPTNPYSSIEGVGRYMNALLSKYNGNYEEAVAAYNAGPAAVDHAIAKYGEANFIDGLPTETRNYLNGVFVDPALPTAADVVGAISGMTPAQVTGAFAAAAALNSATAYSNTVTATGAPTNVSATGVPNPTVGQMQAAIDVNTPTTGVQDPEHAALAEQAAVAAANSYSATVTQTGAPTDASATGALNFGINDIGAAVNEAPADARDQADNFAGITGLAGAYMSMGAASEPSAIAGLSAAGNFGTLDSGAFSGAAASATGMGYTGGYSFSGPPSEDGLSNATGMGAYGGSYATVGAAPAGTDAGSVGSSVGSVGYGGGLGEGGFGSPGSYGGYGGGYGDGGGTGGGYGSGGGGGGWNTGASADSGGMGADGGSEGMGGSTNGGGYGGGYGTGDGGNTGGGMGGDGGAAGQGGATNGGGYGGGYGGGMGGDGGAAGQGGATNGGGYGGGGDGNGGGGSTGGSSDGGGGV